MLEFALSFHDLAVMVAAGVAEEHNGILGYSYVFFHISNAVLSFYSETGR